MGVSHDEKCRKYKQQIENLKLDLEELQEKYDDEVQKNKNLKKGLVTIQSKIKDIRK